MSKTILEQSIATAVATAFAAGYESALDDASSTIATSAIDDDSADLALDELDKMEDICQFAYRTDEYMAAVTLPSVNQMEFRF